MASAIACQHFGEMDGAARGVLRDLFAATEAVADQEIVWPGGADSGQEHAFGKCLRDFEFVGLEAEGAGHAAAARIEQIDLRSGRAQKVDLVVHGH